MRVRITTRERTRPHLFELQRQGVAVKNPKKLTRNLKRLWSLHSLDHKFNKWNN